LQTIHSNEILNYFSLMKSTPDTRTQLRTVASTTQLRALRSTLRQDLVDRVQALGLASVPELATQLGRPADALYYHVRALLRAGLLVEAGSRQRGRHHESLYSTAEPDRRLILQYRNGAEETGPLRELVAAMLRSARREFDCAIADPDCVVDGPERELWAGRSQGWLTRAELAQVNRLLLELNGLLSAPRSARRNRLYSLQFLLAPSLSGQRVGTARKRGKSNPSKSDASTPDKEPT
jgi:DNA-binding transcriptional ArsR family regulator